MSRWVWLVRIIIAWQHGPLREHALPLVLSPNYCRLAHPYTSSFKDSFWVRQVDSRSGADL